MEVKNELAQRHDILVERGRRDALMQMEKWKSNYQNAKDQLDQCDSRIERKNQLIENVIIYLDTKVLGMTPYAEVHVRVFICLCLLTAAQEEHHGSVCLAVVGEICRSSANPIMCTDGTKTLRAESHQKSIVWLAKSDRHVMEKGGGEKNTGV